MAAAKRYKLQTALVAPLARGPNYQFRVAYELPHPGGGIRIVSIRNPGNPVITVPKGGTVVQTTNATAQRM